MTEPLRTTTIIALVLMSICAVVAIVALFLLHRHVSTTRGGDPRTIHFVGPDRVVRTIALDTLRGAARRRDSADGAVAGDEGHFTALADAVNHAVNGQCPDCFLTYREPKHNVHVEVDLPNLLRDPELIAYTAHVPLFATPKHAVEDDDRDSASSFDDVLGSVPKDPSSAAPIIPAVPDPAGRRLPLVAPRIYPTVNPDTLRIYQPPRHKSLTGKVAICTNRYILAKDFTKLAPLPDGAVKLLDTMYVHDFARGKTLTERSSGPVRVRKHDGQIAHAPSEVFMVADVLDGTNCTTVVAVPSNVRVCWGAEAMWSAYDGPFTLPLGRWCVRAEAINREGETCCTPVASARVYEMHPKREGE